MQIFHYHPVTKELIGQGNARRSPLDSKWLVPAHATAVEPPKVESGQTAVFDEKSDQWSVVIDQRGKRFFDLESGRMAEVAALGVSVPADAPTEPPPDDLKVPAWDGKAWTGKSIEDVRLETLAEIDALKSIADIKTFLKKMFAPEPKGHDKDYEV